MKRMWRREWFEELERKKREEKEKEEERLQGVIDAAVLASGDEDAG